MRALSSSNVEHLEPLVVTLPEAARLLGISMASIYNLIGKGELTRVKIGKSARIPMSDVRRLAGEGQ